MLVLSEPHQWRSLLHARGCGGRVKSTEKNGRYVGMSTASAPLSSSTEAVVVDHHGSNTLWRANAAATFMAELNFSSQLKILLAIGSERG